MVDKKVDALASSYLCQISFSSSFEIMQLHHIVLSYLDKSASIFIFISNYLIKRKE
jgi:hypothetical protein